MSSDELPYMSKNTNGGAIIALESHGYYLDVKQDHGGWSFKIDDWHNPKRPKITPWKRVSDPSKLETSRLTKRIRESLKEILRYSYEDSLNRILHLLEVNSYEWPIPEDAEKPELEHKPTLADLIIETIVAEGVSFFCDQFARPHVLIPTNIAKRDEKGVVCVDRVVLSPPQNVPDESDIDIVSVENINIEENTTQTAHTTRIINKIYSLNSQLFKQYISALIWEKFEKAPKNEFLKTAINVFGGMAQANEIIKLSNRVAEDEEGNWWLDLSNDRWEAVKITDEDWGIETPPPIFKRHNHQIPLATPVKGGDPSLMLDYIRLADVNNQLLWLVTQISYLIPDIPHPISCLWGEQGSIKTTAQLFIKKLLDNSSVELLSMPHKFRPNELIQNLDHHYICGFDNISKIDDSQSDILCRAVTGTGMSKRKLYSDAEDYITAFKRCVTTNGIAITIGKPDLGNRTIQQETIAIPKSLRRKDKEVLKDFKLKSPEILGGFLDILVKVRNIAKTLKIDSLNRMADYTFWGAAITEAMNIHHDKFLIAYNENINQQEIDSIRSNQLGEILLEFLEANFTKEITEIKGTTTNIYRRLTRYADSMEISTKEDYPQNSKQFGIRILEILPNLPSVGYKVTRKRSNKGQVLTFSRLIPTKLDDTFEYSEKKTKNVWKHEDLRDILRGNQPDKEPEKPKVIPLPPEFDPHKKADLKTQTPNLALELKRVLVSLRKAQKITGGDVNQEDFIKLQKAEGNDNVERILEVLLRDGAIFSPRPGYLKTTEDSP